MDKEIDIFPAVDRHANDQAIMLLMQQVHDKVHMLDERLSKHMTSETLQLAEEITKLMNKAFPEADPEGHRAAHEAWIRKAEKQAAFWDKMLFEITRWGIIGVLGWVIYSLWKSFLTGPK